MGESVSGTQLEIDQRIYDLYDEYCHGRMDRREFLAKAAAMVVGGLAMAQALFPRYALAQTISFTDNRIKANYVTYPSPGGSSGQMKGYLVQPTSGGTFPSVLVIHENRGLNPYIEDVARRLPRQRRRRPRAASEARPGAPAHRHVQQRALSKEPQALQLQARRDRLLLGRRRDQLPGNHARLADAGRRSLLRRRARCGSSGKDQVAATNPVRRERSAHQRHVARLRSRP